ncbi:hypothetical protein V8C86DRAFT_3147220 [Haematococcus lacustris]
MLATNGLLRHRYEAHEDVSRSSKAEAARADPSPLHGKAVSDRRLGRLHLKGQAAVLCSQQPSSRQQDPVIPSSHASRPSEPAETGHLGIHSLQGPHLPQQPNSGHKLHHGIQAPASEGDCASAKAIQPAMPGGATRLVMPFRRARHSTMFRQLAERVSHCLGPGLEPVIAYGDDAWAAGARGRQPLPVSGILKTLNVRSAAVIGPAGGAATWTAEATAEAMLNTPGKENEPARAQRHQRRRMRRRFFAQ